MMSKTRIRDLVVAVSLAVVGSSAQAFVLKTGNLSESGSWSFSTGGVYADDPLQGTYSITANFVSGSEVDLTITLTNTTVDSADPGISGGKNARLTAFGFGINPDATGVTFFDAQGSDGGMVDAAMDSIPSLKTIEICAYGGVNCPGGSNGGIYANGNFDTFVLKLAGTWDASAGVDIDPLGWKYQTNAGSYEFTSSSSGRIITSGPVPEPGTLSLLGGAMLAGLFRYRQRRQATA